MGQNNITLFPNPVKDILKIELTEKNLPASYLIYDIQGRLLQAGLERNSSFSLDMSSYQTGLYCLVIRIDNQVFSYLISRVSQGELRVPSF
jgi:hypothetical protein